MTWSLKQSNTAASTTTSPATPAYGSGTTAGNLLILVVNVAGGTTQPTPPAGWSLVSSATVSSPNTGSVWIFANFANAGGITTVSTSFTGTTCHSQLYEFTCPGVAGVTAADASGNTNAATIASSLAITTSGNLAANNELAFSSYLARYSAATAATLTAGAGFTQGGQLNNGTSVSPHSTFDYELDTGSSAGTTVTDTVANNSTGAGSTTGAIATFSQPATGGGQAFTPVNRNIRSRQRWKVPPRIPVPPIIYPAGNQPGGVVYRRLPARAVVGNHGQVGSGTTAVAQYNGSQPGGLVKRRAPARAVVGKGQPGGGLAGAAFYNGSQPGGIVRRRYYARAVTARVSGAPPPSTPAAGQFIVSRRPSWSVTQGWAVQPQGTPAGSLPPGGIAVKRRSAARAVVGSQGQPGSGLAGRAFYNGSPAGGVVYRRRPARAVTVINGQPGGGFAGRAFYNGSPAGGVVYRRRPARAVAGKGQPGGGFAARAFYNGAPAGGVVYRRRPARAIVGNGQSGGGFAARAFYNGSPAGGVVYRRRPARAVTGSLTSPFINPAGNQPGGLIVRRVFSRSITAGRRVLPSSVAVGSQPGGLIAYRRPIWSVWRGAFSAPANVPATPGKQPLPTRQPRRTSARAYTFWIPVQTVITPAAGSIQPKATVPLPRRYPARAVTGSSTRDLGAFPPPVGAQPGGVVYRRRPARAVVSRAAGVSFPNGSIQPHATIIARRTSARAVTGSRGLLWGGPTATAQYNGSPAGGVVYRRKPARAVTGKGQPGGGFAGIAFLNGSQPGGIVRRRSSARAVFSSTHGAPPPSVPAAGQLIVSRRPSWSIAQGWAVQSSGVPSGSQPGGFIAYRRPAWSVWRGAVSARGNAAAVPGRQPSATRQPRRSSARAYTFWIPVQTVNAQTGGSIQPLPTRLPRRTSARAYTNWIPVQTANAQATPGRQPLSTRQPRRTSARAYTNWIPVQTVNAQFAFIATGGFVQSRRPVSSIWGGVSGPSPPPVFTGVTGGLIVYRRPSWSVWRGAVSVTANVPAVPGQQPPSTRQPRRTSARAYTFWIPVQTVNAQTAGSVQPRATVPVPRRYPSRLVWAGSSARDLGPFPPPNGSQPGGLVALKRRPAPRAVINSNVSPFIYPAGSQPGGLVVRRVLSRSIAASRKAPFPPPSGTLQPRGAVPVPRRTTARAIWARVSGPFPSVSGKLQPRGAVPVPRRTAARAVWAKVSGRFPSSRGSQPGGIVRRRSPARAVPQFEVIYGSPPTFFPPPTVFPALVSITPVNQNAASVAIAVAGPPFLAITPVNNSAVAIAPLAYQSVVITQVAVASAYGSVYGSIYAGTTNNSPQVQISAVTPAAVTITAAGANAASVLTEPVTIIPAFVTIAPVPSSHIIAVNPLTPAWVTITPAGPTDITVTIAQEGDVPITEVFSPNAPVILELPGTAVIAPGEATLGDD